MQFKREYFKSFIFGVEDSLVSTVGLLSGVALAGMPPQTVVLTGVVLICVEAFSMAAGEYLSERETEEYQSQSAVSGRVSLTASAIMFVSYFVSGLIPLMPYVGATSAYSALPYSVAFSLGALCVLGLIGGRMTGTGYVRHAVRMVGVGGVAILVGILAGQIVGV